MTDDYSQRIRTFVSSDWTGGVSQQLKLLLLDTNVRKAYCILSPPPRLRHPPTLLMPDTTVVNIQAGG